MEILYEKYQNIQKCITSYRKYIVKDSFHDFNTFKKMMQVDQYVHHKCENPVNNKTVYVYLFKDQSVYTKTTSQFKRLMDKISKDVADVIIISKNELSVYIKKSFDLYRETLTIYNYLHKIFAIELSKGPLCSPHRILSNSEVRTLCSKDLMVHPLSLPSISVNDAHNIWIGGTLGQVVEIESVSEITGKTNRYRIVSPDSGTIINIQKTIVEKKIKPMSEETDEISEYVDDVDEDPESESGEE